MPFLQRQNMAFCRTEGMWTEAFSALALQHPVRLCSSGCALPPLLVFHLPPHYLPQPLFQILALHSPINLHAITKAHAALVFFLAAYLLCHLTSLLPLFITELAVALVQQ